MLLTPDDGDARRRAPREWEGLGALRTLLGMTLVYPFTACPGTPPASRLPPCPAGFTADGLPLSVQLVGRPEDEATLLSLAAQIEAERPWADAVRRCLTGPA